MQATDTFDRFSPANVQDPYRALRPDADPAAVPRIPPSPSGRGYGDVRTVLTDHERLGRDFDIRSPSTRTEVAEVLATGYAEVRLVLNEGAPAAAPQYGRWWAQPGTPRRGAGMTPSACGSWPVT